MDRTQKAAVIDEVAGQIQEAEAVFAVDYRGISVPQAAELRTRLREADASFTVVKNRLAKRATEGAGATDLDEHLVGPTALTFVRGDAVLAAKAVSDFIRTTGVLSYKGGMMDGAVLGPDQFVSIARLPGVDVLRGQLVGLAASPLTGIVRTLNQLIAGMASQLGQIAERGLVSGEAPAPAETGDEPASADASPDPDEAEIAEAPGTEEAGEEAAEEATSEDAPAETADPEANAPAGPDEPAVDAEPPDESDGADAPEQSQDSESDTETEETTSEDDDAGSEDEKEK